MKNLIIEIWSKNVNNRIGEWTKQAFRFSFSFRFRKSEPLDFASLCASVSTLLFGDFPFSCFFAPLVFLRITLPLFPSEFFEIMRFNSLETHVKEALHRETCILILETASLNHGEMGQGTNIRNIQKCPIKSTKNNGLYNDIRIQNIRAKT